MLDSPRARWFGLVIISLGVSLVIIDATIVNVAIPSIIDDIGLTSTQAQWVREIYTRPAAPRTRPAHRPTQPPAQH